MPDRTMLVFNPISLSPFRTHTSSNPLSVSHLRAFKCKAYLPPTIKEDLFQPRSWDYRNYTDRPLYSKRDDGTAVSCFEFNYRVTNTTPVLQPILRLRHMHALIILSISQVTILEPVPPWLGKLSECCHNLPHRPHLKKGSKRGNPAQNSKIVQANRMVQISFLRNGLLATGSGERLLAHSLWVQQLRQVRGDYHRELKLRRFLADQS